MPPRLEMKALWDHRQGYSTGRKSVSPLVRYVHACCQLHKLSSPHHGYTSQHWKPARFQKCAFQFNHKEDHFRANEDCRGSTAQTHSSVQCVHVLERADWRCALTPGVRRCTLSPLSRVSKPSLACSLTNWIQLREEKQCLLKPQQTTAYARAGLNWLNVQMEGSPW